MTTLKEIIETTPDAHDLAKKIVDVITEMSAKVEGIVAKDDKIILELEMSDKTGNVLIVPIDKLQAWVAE